MTSRTPTRYAVRVAGHLDDHWAAWLGSWELHRDVEGDTTLTGRAVDQAQLHGLLAGLRDIGATVLSVTPDGEWPAEG